MQRLWVLFKSLLFTLTGPLLVGIIIPYFVAGPFVIPHNLLQLVPGGLVMAIGFGIYCWCVWNFASEGRGTPAPVDPPKSVVAVGLYCYTRNPMYVGVLTFVFGLAILMAKWSLLLYGLIVGICFHSFVVFYEEPALCKKFNGIYEEYCRRVRRWL